MNRTNLALQSGDLSTTWVTNANALIATNVDNDPLDGALVVDQLQDDNGGGLGEVMVGQTITLEPSTRYTFSAYATGAGVSDFGLRITGMAAQSLFQVYDLSGAGFMDNPQAADTIDRGIDLVADGFYRAWFSFDTDAVDVTCQIELLLSGDGEALDNVPLDNTSRTNIWGIQLEPAAAPTEYIPTTTEAVTVFGEARKPGEQNTDGNRNKRENRYSYAGANDPAWRHGGSAPHNNRNRNRFINMPVTP